jgi:exopolyphosphatase/guanosine-5'-triphosphate,3'-diphosphate pyrophosphatase
MRVATIDIGTNTVLLLVAERDEKGTLRALTERAEITRLGQGVDRTKRLLPEAVERTAACLQRYAREVAAAKVDRVTVVGTSAMRDAQGGDRLIELVRAAFAVDVRVLSGDEEARVTFRGALHGLGVDAGGAAAVFDIGGGSTEIIVGRLRDGRLEARFLKSFDVGSVRLTERLVTTDPPSPGEMAAVDAALRETFALVPPLPEGVVPVGVAGTMTTLAAVAIEMATYDGSRVHGLTLETAHLSRVAARLATCTLDERRRLAGMEPKRADVIVAGARIALALLRHWNAPRVLVSDGGVRWGLAEELAS